jgi:hypothetical protein
MAYYVTGLHDVTQLNFSQICLELDWRDLAV